MFIREVSKFLNISRNFVIFVYEELESKGIIIIKRGIGIFVFIEGEIESYEYIVDFILKFNEYVYIFRKFDIIKSELFYKKGMIFFKFIFLESDFFNFDDFKRFFLDVWNFEELNLLNYGYVKGYKFLIDYFFDYMKDKCVKVNNKDILIINGFIEVFDIIIGFLIKFGDVILCEKLIYNIVLKIMKFYGLKII